MDLPLESQIVNGLCQLDCTIFNIEDVLNFLSQNISNKKNADRFISWLISLDILTQNRQSWGTELYLMSKNYVDTCNEYFSQKKNDPLAFLSKCSQLMIKSDIECGMQWFYQILRDTHLKKFINSPLLRLSRIYSMISLYNEKYIYNSNAYHLGCICLIMASIFSSYARLSIDFAESIAFYLTRSILSFIPLQQTQENKSLIYYHFDQVDQLIQIKAPDQSKAIRNNKSSSVYFGIRYEQLLFSRENHRIDDILNIWDQIIIHFNRIEFISCLTVAHICQIQIPQGPQNVNEIISNWKNWDTIKIIEDALEMLEHKRSLREKCCFYLGLKSNLSGWNVSNLKL